MLDDHVLHLVLLDPDGESKLGALGAPNQERLEEEGGGGARSTINRLVDTTDVSPAKQVHLGTQVNLQMKHIISTTSQRCIRQKDALCIASRLTTTSRRCIRQKDALCNCKPAHYNFTVMYRTETCAMYCKLAHCLLQNSEFKPPKQLG